MHTNHLLTLSWQAQNSNATMMARSLDATRPSHTTVSGRMSTTEELGGTVKNQDEQVAWHSPPLVQGRKMAFDHPAPSAGGSLGGTPGLRDTPAWSRGCGLRNRETIISVRMYCLLHRNSEFLSTSDELLRAEIRTRGASPLTKLLSEDP